MTNKATKRALVTSIISMLICVVMLAGTTFAWFTDSVTSGVNKIVAGNLDVDVLYFDKEQNKNVSVSAVDKLFKDVTLWEPGAAAWENLTVVNLGTLALKYELSINFDNKNTVDGNDLSEALKIGVVKNGITATKRDAVLAEVTTWTELSDFVKQGNLDKGCEDKYGVVIWWEPSALDNDWNVNNGKVTSDGKPLHIDLGVRLYATQDTVEADSFDDQYDKDAKIIHAILAHGGTANLNEAFVDDATIPENVEVTINGDSNAIEGNVTNNGDVVINDAVINNDAAGFENTGDATLNDVTINAGSPADYSNIISGTEATTVYNDVDIVSEGGGIGAVDGANVVFNSGSVAVNSPSTSGRYVFYTEGAGSTVTINGGTFSFSKTLNQKRAYVYAGEDTTVYITGGSFGPASTRSGYTAGILGNGQVIITGGTFGFDPTNWVAEGYEAEKNAEGNWVVEPAIKNSTDIDEAIKAGETTLILGSGEYVIPDSAKGKTLRFIGTKDTVIVAQNDGAAEGNCDYCFDGSTVTFDNVTIKTTGTYLPGYARMKGTFNKCTINGVYALYDDSEFNDCTFNVSGDLYNVWTWGAANATFAGCTFNNDGKAVLLYGGVNTKLTVNNCVFNDNGDDTVTGKAAIETGNDYGKSYELFVNNTTVNGYSVNASGINTGSTLWANKNSMGTDKLNVVVDGVDVY